MGDTSITPDATSAPDLDPIIVPRQSLQPPGLWRVVLHNDDFTPMAFVIALLRSVFHKDSATAERLTLLVHTQGQAEIAHYTKEVAVTKVMVVSQLAAQDGHPLLATAQPA